MNFQFMVFITALVALLALSELALAAKVKSVLHTLNEAQKALSAVKQAADDYPRIANEVQDIRSTLEELPLDDLVAQAQFEKAYADGLENISTYSVEVAMRGGGDNS